MNDTLVGYHTVNVTWSQQTGPLQIELLKSSSFVCAAHVCITVHVH